MSLLFAISAITILGFAALALDTGFMLVTKAELQNVADSAAASGNLELARIYDELGPSVDPEDYTLTAEDKARIYAAADEFAKKNEAAGVAVSILPDDLLYGTWDRGSGTFATSDTGVNAVGVYARRDGVGNGSVQTQLASVVGVDEFDVGADATAAMSPISLLPRGKGEFPVGIDHDWFLSRDSPCGPDSYIKFYPTGDLEGCAGWHTFQSWPSNAWMLKWVLTGIEHGEFESPEIQVDDTHFVFTGGTVDSALQKAEDAYLANRDENGEWLVHVPVYQANGCANPSGWIKIVGIASVRINDVVPTGGDKRIAGNVACDVVMFGEGGGPDYGTEVGLPELVN